MQLRARHQKLDLQGGSMTVKTITALLVEDHEITRLGLRKILEQVPSIQIIAEAGDGRTAVDKAIELNPDLVFMDIGLPDMDGIEATRSIKNAVSTKVIMITSHENTEDIFAGLGAGADAYCLKGVSGAQLANAIHSVMGGAVWLDPGIAQQVVNAASKGSIAVTTTSRTAQTSTASPVNSNNPFRLSDREFQVLTLLVEGLSNQQIAERLYLSTETIKTHMRHIMEKLQVSDRTQAAVKALSYGLLPLADMR
jgi:two-component system, NarL family, response regulator LiaR